MRSEVSAGESEAQKEEEGEKQRIAGRERGEGDSLGRMAKVAVLHEFS